VSALAHARLLDQYAGAVEALERLREEHARSSAAFREVKEAAGAQAALLLKLQEGRRNDESLRATVRSQQELVRRLEQAVDVLQGQVGGMAEAAAGAERRAAKAEQATREARERVAGVMERADALERVPRLDPREEGALRAQLAAKAQRLEVMEEQMVAASSNYARELAAMQSRLMDMEAALAERDARVEAIGSSLHGRINRAAEEAGSRFAASSFSPPKPQQFGGYGARAPVQQRFTQQQQQQPQQQQQQFRQQQPQQQQQQLVQEQQQQQRHPTSAPPYRTYEGSGSGGGGGGSSSRSRPDSGRGGAGGGGRYPPPEEDFQQFSKPQPQQPPPQAKGKGRPTRDQLDEDLRNIDNLLAGLI